MWRGIGYHIDTAFQYHGKTYFFKGKGYWEFNDQAMKVAHTDLKPSAVRWMGCSSSPRLPYTESNEDDDDDNSVSTSSATTLTLTTTFLPNHHRKYAFFYLVVLAVLQFR